MKTWLATVVVGQALQMECSVKVVLVAGSPGATGGQVGQTFVTVTVKAVCAVWVKFAFLVYV